MLTSGLYTQAHTHMYRVHPYTCAFIGTKTRMHTEQTPPLQSAVHSYISVLAVNIVTGRAMMESPVGSLES